jgi:hypothetical protein
MRITIATAAVGLAAFVSACHEKPAPLTPDLTVAFQCAGVPSGPAIEAFMQAHGFHVFDAESARRKKGKVFFPLQIDGLDAHRVMLEVIGLKEPVERGGAVRYKFTILSPPPTQHDTQLESDAVAFLKRASACNVESVDRGMNDSASQAQFDLVFDAVKRRIESAR